MLTRDIDTIVRSLLMTDEAGINKFTPLDGNESDQTGTEILADVLYRYDQLDDKSQQVSLQVYLGVGEVGAQLWDQEVKVLLRVAGLEHPALPEVLDGGHLEAWRVGEVLDGRAERVAYVRTRSEQQVDAEDIDDLIEQMHADRAWAVRQILTVTDALAILHDTRIAHRNLWPGTLQFRLESDRVAIRINRFEMSALLGNILRPTSVDASGRDVVRALYRSQGARALRYMPPERLRFLFSSELSTDDPLDGPGSAEGDVFGLGMIAAEWLLGGFGDLAAPEADSPSLADILEFQRTVRVRVRTSPDIPPAMGALLDDMLDPHRTGRPTTAQTLERLSRNYDGIQSALEGVASTEALPHLLLYLPETRSNLANWELHDDPTENDPRVIARIIEDDLRGALVVESPDGAEPFLENWQGDTPEKLKQARWVLIGPKAAWFCRPYELRNKLKRSGESLPDVYVIGYVAVRHKISSRARDKLDALTAGSLNRRIGSVRVESDQIAPAALHRLRQGRPEWTSLFESVRQPVQRTSWEQEFGQALDWLLEFQGAQLAARTYAFRRDPAALPGAKEVALHWDRAQDRDRRNKMPAMHAKLLRDPLARPAFGYFFAEGANRDEGSLSYLQMSRVDDSGQITKVGEFRFVRSIGEDTVVVAPASTAHVPEQGLLGLQEDRGTTTSLRRQRDARDELVKNRVLVNRLRKPLSVRGDASRWHGASGALEGEGAHVVVDMLCHQPMFALQGPPGTGKTEISSQAVHAYLRADPGARVLVSAQSHYALDNLAARILTKIGLLDENGRPLDADFAAIRVFNERAHDRVDPRLRPFQAGASAVRMRNSIRRRVISRLNSRVDVPHVRSIAESWLAELEGSEIEMGERLRRGSNIVFVTCAAATQETLVDNGAREPFDWVLIEEAAKAWPTELALPLVRGLRWTMVGDHKQIGAYGATEVERFLESCSGDPDPSIAEHHRRKDTYLRAFAMFGRMIEDAPPVGPRGTRGPVQTLVEQRRMRDPISQVVSRTFYPVTEPADAPPEPGELPEGLLVTRRTEIDHVFAWPDWLTGSAVAWLDTSGVNQDEGFWRNRYEADVVTRFVRDLRPEPTLSARPEKDTRTGLAVLTPYRQQVEAIIESGPELKEAVRTVDAFQGRDADIVVVSLVRDRARSSWERPLSNIGHLADASRVNVMLSRARDLLVLVGSFDHFAGSGVPIWQSVTTAVERFGTRRSAVDR